MSIAAILDASIEARDRLSQTIRSTSPQSLERVEAVNQIDHAVMQRLHGSAVSEARENGEVAVVGPLLQRLRDAVDLLCDVAVSAEDHYSRLWRDAEDRLSEAVWAVEPYSATTGDGANADADVNSSNVQGKPAKQKKRGTKSAGTRKMDLAVDYIISNPDHADVSAAKLAKIVQCDPSLFSRQENRSRLESARAKANRNRSDPTTGYGSPGGIEAVDAKYGTSHIEHEQYKDALLESFDDE